MSRKEWNALVNERVNRGLTPKIVQAHSLSEAVELVESPTRWSSPMSLVRSPVLMKRFRRAMTILKNLFGFSDKSIKQQGSTQRTRTS